MIKGLIFIVILLLAVNDCKGENMISNENILDLKENLDLESLKEVCKKKIYFGHQSVGFNIIEGIRDIIKDNPSFKLNILETRYQFDFESPIFAHSTIGHNQNPYSKCDEFKKIMENGVGNKVEIAFFKFCYVDVDRNTNILALFDYYAGTISQLESEFPQVKFVYFTVPLTTYNLGINSRIKRLLNIGVPGDLDNIRRNEFNEMICKKYQGSHRLFDLAKYESKSLDGKMNNFESGNKNFPTLQIEYAKDDGHLNCLGRRLVAVKLLDFLTKLK